MRARVGAGVAAVDAFDPDVLEGEGGQCGRVQIDAITGVVGVRGIRVLDQDPLDVDLAGGARAQADVEAVAGAVITGAGSGQKPRNVEAPNAFKRAARLSNYEILL